MPKLKTATPKKIAPAALPAPQAAPVLAPKDVDAAVQAVRHVPQPAPVPIVAAPVPNATASRPGWTAPTVLTAPKKKSKSSVATTQPGAVVPVADVDEAYAAKQAMDNAKAAYEAQAGVIKALVVDFLKGQPQTLNIPSSTNICAQVSVKKDTLALKDPARAKEIAGNYFGMFFGEEISGVVWTIAPQAVPAVKAALQAAGIDLSYIQEAVQATYTVRDTWHEKQGMLATFLGDEQKAEELRGCVELARSSGTSLRFVGSDD
jgi:hypothetical protein